MSSKQAHNNHTDLPLGKSVNYPDSYNPEILFRIPRDISKAKQFGFDRWFCYELSFLSETGLPVNIGLDLSIPADSPYIVESKSLKLYLGSLASEKFKNPDSCALRIKSDLQKLLESPLIEVETINLSQVEKWAVTPLPGESIDNPATDCSQFDNPEKTLIETRNHQTKKTLNSAIFRSLCPVTQQPDFASIVIQYEGQEIINESLLRYLVSYRKHSGFHESCCEKIFADLMDAAELKELTVACYFTRRGGIEINPLRSSLPVEKEKWQLRTVRQ